VSKHLVGSKYYFLLAEWPRGGKPHVHNRWNQFLGHVTPSDRYDAGELINKQQTIGQCANVRRTSRVFAKSWKGRSPGCNLEGWASRECLIKAKPVNVIIKGSTANKSPLQVVKDIWGRTGGPRAIPRYELIHFFNFCQPATELMHFFNRLSPN
jgi:hypothetical protein